MLTLPAISLAEANRIASESAVTLPIQIELSRFDCKESLNAFCMSFPRVWEWTKLVISFYFAKGPLQHTPPAVGN